MLTETVEIPENFMPLAFERLVELTVQELEVSSIMLDLFFNSLFLNRQSCITNFPFLLQIPSEHTDDLLPASEVIPETTLMGSETFNFQLLITILTEKINARLKFTS